MSGVSKPCADRSFQYLLFDQQFRLGPGSGWA
jgi:hypothetical protein